MDIKILNGEIIKGINEIENTLDKMYKTEYVKTQLYVRILLFEQLKEVYLDISEIEFINIAQWKFYDKYLSRTEKQNVININELDKHKEISEKLNQIVQKVLSNYSYDFVEEIRAVIENIKNGKNIFITAGFDKALGKLSIDYVKEYVLSSKTNVYDEIFELIETIDIAVEVFERFNDSKGLSLSDLQETNDTLNSLKEKINIVYSIDSKIAKNFVLDYFKHKLSFSNILERLQI